jgi:hypothetical protein
MHPPLVRACEPEKTCRGGPAPRRCADPSPYVRPSPAPGRTDQVMQARAPLLCNEGTAVLPTTPHRNEVHWRGKLDVQLRRLLDMRNGAEQCVGIGLARQPSSTAVAPPLKYTRVGTSAAAPEHLHEAANPVGVSYVTHGGPTRGCRAWGPAAPRSKLTRRRTSAL